MNSFPIRLVQVCSGLYGDSLMSYFILLSIAWIFIVILSTHCFTTCRFLFHSLTNRRHRGKEPRTLPYKIPFVGHALQMIENAHAFFDLVVSKSAPDCSPIRIRLGHLHAYIIFGSSNVQRIFRSSKSLTFEEFALRVAQKVKRLPTRDAVLVGADRSGSSSKPLTDVADETRIWRKFHEIYEFNLVRGQAVSSLTHRFIEEFQVQINQMPIVRTWTKTGINDMLQDIMLRASTRTLAGPGVLDIDHDFVKKFWEYDDYFMSLLYGLPRFLLRKGSDARDHCLDTVRRYLAKAWNSVDWEECRHLNPEWEAHFGSKLMRDREEAMEKFGITLEGRASFELGLIWSINSNAIPMASWMLFEILQRPSLLAQIREECSSTIYADEETGKTKLDVPALLKQPLLSSVYQECLRLRTSVDIVRQLRNDIEVDGFTLKAGNLIIAPSYLGHQDATRWSDPGHPEDEFWPERFLGRKAPDAGSFFPYGGGSATCPGRYYAKQEILAAIALMLTSFDFEVLHFVTEKGKKSERGPELGCESRGVARIDRDLLVNLRKTCT